MKAKEYMELAKKADKETRNNPNQHELFTYVYVWLQSRQPELAKELEQQFKEIELQVSTAREIEKVLYHDQLYDNRLEDLEDDAKFISGL